MDDFLLLANSASELRSNLSNLLELLKALGLEVNLAKSVLEPKQVIDFLGFVIDLQHGSIHVPKQKLHSVLDDIKRLINDSSPSLQGSQHIRQNSCSNFRYASYPYFDRPVGSSPETTPSFPLGI